jgi:mono/diheme cytochrome c family protein
MLLHTSELHAATTHLAVIAVLLYAALLVLRCTPWSSPAARASEAWVLGAAVVGMILAGVTGLIVRGQSQTELRGNAGRLGTAHFWLGIVLAAIVFVPAIIALIRARRPRPGPDVPTGISWTALGVVGVLAVLGQGYLGGRMTYHHGVGVDAGGQFAQTAVGAERLAVSLSHGTSQTAAGRAAFAESGLGCATCHGDRAQGARGPRLAGGREVAEFRHVHGRGLFPPAVVTDRDFAAIDAYLRTLGPPGGRGGD